MEALIELKWGEVCNIRLGDYRELVASALHWPDHNIGVKELRGDDVRREHSVSCLLEHQAHDVITNMTLPSQLLRVVLAGKIDLVILLYSDFY